MAVKTATPPKRKVVSRTAGKLTSKHIGHANHLCELVNHRRMTTVASLSKGAKYICNVCGRAAAKAANLCEPVDI